MFKLKYIKKNIFRIGDFLWFRTTRLSDNKDDHNKDNHNIDFDKDIYKKDYHYKGPHTQDLG